MRCVCEGVGVHLLRVVPSLSNLIYDFVAQDSDVFSNFLYCYVVFGP